MSHHGVLFHPTHRRWSLTERGHGSSLSPAHPSLTSCLLPTSIRTGGGKKPDNFLVWSWRSRGKVRGGGGWLLQQLHTHICFFLQVFQLFLGTDDDDTPPGYTHTILEETDCVCMCEGGVRWTCSEDCSILTLYFMLSLQAKPLSAPSQEGGHLQHFNSNNTPTSPIYIHKLALWPGYSPTENITNASFSIILDFAFNKASLRMDKCIPFFNSKSLCLLLLSILETILKYRVRSDYRLRDPR